MHEIVRTRISGQGPGAAFAAPAAGDALQAAFAHQPLDTLVVHLATEPEAQLRGHPAGAVGAEALLVDLGDEVTEFAVGEHPLGRIRLGVTPGVERRSRHLHRATARLDRQIGTPVSDEGVDHFGRTFSRAKYADARFKISTSSSSTRVLRRNATNSARSSLVRPGLAPSSTSACFTQPRKHESEIPSSLAI